MENLPLKAVGTQREALEDVLKSVSPDSLAQAAQTLASARLIDLYSVENSCAPASDLLTKLTYLGLRCRFCTDAYLQQISAAHLRKGDVAVAFSRSGRSVDTVKALRLAKKAGAATIAVTGERTALLSRYADLTLSVGGGGPKPSMATPFFPGWRTWRWWICCIWASFSATMSGFPATWTAAGR